MRHPFLSIGLALLPALASAEALAQAPEASAASSRWVDELRLDVFVDAFAAMNSQGNAHALTDAAAGHRDYVYTEGFQLSFAGLDARYERGKIGATASLRFGPSVVRYFGDNGGLGFDNLTQAYLTWKPADAISIDFGQFSTLYGAEVAESWLNANYTRGALYYAMQPFWHVGVRANYQASDALRLSAMVVNGVNNPVDFDETPGLGAQAAFSGDGFGVILGYMWTANDTEKDAFDFFEHLVDLIVTAEAGAFGLVFNADYGIAGDTSFYGASLTPRLTLSENIGVALRGEYLAYPDNAGADFVAGAGGVYEGLVTVTGTLDWRPVGNSHFVLRPEARYEMALGADAFADADGKATAGWWTLVLGAVVNSF
jgi:hypothetical protein